MKYYKAVLKQGNKFKSIICFVMSNISNDKNKKYTILRGNKLIYDYYYKTKGIMKDKQGMWFFKSEKDVMNWINHIENDDMTKHYLTTKGKREYWLMTADIKDENIIERGNKSYTKENIEYIKTKEIDIKNVTFFIRYLHRTTSLNKKDEVKK